MVPGKKYTPEDILWIAWRRRWLIVVPFVLAGAGAIVHSRSLPNVYQSETLIQVVPQLVPRTMVPSTVTAQIDQRLQSIREQVLNRSRLEELILEFDLYPERRREGLMEDVVQRMQTDISVTITRAGKQRDATTLFRLSYISHNPATASRVAERLASMFVDANLRERELLALGTDQFIEAELNATRARLEEQERGIEEFRTKYPWEQAESVETNRWAEVNAQQGLMNTLNALNPARESLAFLERVEADLLKSASEPGPVRQAPGGRGDAAAAEPAAAQLETAKATLRAMELRLKPEHPDVASAKRVIAELTRKAEEEALAAPVTPDASAPALPTRQSERLLNTRAEMIKLRGRIVELEADEKRFRTLLAEMQQRLQNLPIRVREMAALTRDMATLRARYNELLRKKEAAQIAVNLERRQIAEQMRIIEPARTPNRPISPDRARISLLGAILGLSLGLALAAAFEYRDTSLRTDDDVVAALALPVLALVPVMKTSLELRRSRRRRLIWSATGALGLVASAAAVLWTL